MATAREHIEKIRRNKFSIGAEETNPLTEDLHEAVKNLSAELYAKDVHFLMEIIQNAEDNEYEEGEDPSLDLIHCYLKASANAFVRGHFESTEIGKSVNALRKHGSKEIRTRVSGVWILIEYGKLNSWLRIDIYI
ncbi:PREDICTED: uncharacterized protein LOC107799761 [Olea europaea subsp. europaea]|uniref:PREDICTED: uncharacterized protein LOC107799761 n=1 Tax=Olea europaea subsp. europaea TaxID=158383 RepID=A0A8S0VC57_OLEEU|nr:PREDICTED: uncharacterized protein LOC107799761 [Olea europaea subsp. europaea]